ncbi:hypothetical protein T484DRAFT_1861000 [Baffinella frigidus]|nr:hypothetical protein T484DRAFT_1861000 [Cryptophyta sp. CCMP2293]
MPSRGGDRDEPRPPEDPRTIHSIKTRMNTKNAVANMAVGIKMVELQLRKAGSAPRRRWLKKIRMVIVLAVISMTMWDFIPRERSISEDFGPRRRPQSYGSALFKELFRSSYDQFLRVHSNTGWDPWLHIGKKDHRMWLQSDWVLMCLLRRLAAPARLVDICMQVGGARSTVDDAFLWAVDYFFDQWGDQLSDIGRWKDRFDKFAAHTRGAGCMHHGVIGYVDGNDQFVCRPGGDGCITRVPFQA